MLMASLWYTVVFTEWENQHLPHSDRCIATLRSYHEYITYLFQGSISIYCFVYDLQYFCICLSFPLFV